MAHGQHAETAQFLLTNQHETSPSGGNERTNFGGVEHNRRETRRHFAVQPDLDTSLDLVLGFDQRIKQLIRVDDRLAVVGHETDQRGVPLVHNLREGCGTRAHEDLSNTIVELLNAIVGHPNECLCSSLLRLLVRKVPYRVLERVLFSTHRSNLG